MWNCFPSLSTPNQHPPQLTGALQEAHVLGQVRRELCHSGGASAGALAGLQDHHARREQGKPHELHRQRARKTPPACTNANPAPTASAEGLLVRSWCWQSASPADAPTLHRKVLSQSRWRETLYLCDVTFHSNVSSVSHGLWCCSTGLRPVFSI